MASLSMVGLGILDSFVISYLEAKTFNLMMDNKCIECEARLYGSVMPVWGSFVAGKSLYCEIMHMRFVKKRASWRPSFFLDG
jgi:hypothetical protein